MCTIASKTGAGAMLFQLKGLEVGVPMTKDLWSDMSIKNVHVIPIHGRAKSIPYDRERSACSGQNHSQKWGGWSKAQSTRSCFTRTTRKADASTVGDPAEVMQILSEKLSIVVEYAVYTTSNGVWAGLMNVNARNCTRYLRFNTRIGPETRFTWVHGICSRRPGLQEEWQSEDPSKSKLLMICLQTNLYQRQNRLQKDSKSPRPLEIVWCMKACSTCQMRSGKECGSLKRSWRSRREQRSQASAGSWDGWGCQEEGSEALKKPEVFNTIVTALSLFSYYDYATGEFATSRFEFADKAGLLNMKAGVDWTEPSLARVQKFAKTVAIFMRQSEAVHRKRGDFP